MAGDRNLDGAGPHGIARLVSRWPWSCGQKLNSVGGSGGVLSPPPRVLDLSFVSGHCFRPGALDPHGDTAVKRVSVKISFGGGCIRFSMRFHYEALLGHSRSR
jgi:hypothetical protein